MSRKVGIFTRVSTKRQEEKGFSLQMQLNLATTHANNLGYKIAKVYKEVGSVSKKTIDKRSVMQELIADIKEGDIDYLITYKRDRLFRNHKEHMGFLDILAEHNVELYLTATNEIQVDIQAFKNDSPINPDLFLEFMKIVKGA